MAVWIAADVLTVELLEGEAKSQVRTLHCDNRTKAGQHTDSKVITNQKTAKRDDNGDRGNTPAKCKPFGSFKNDTRTQANGSICTAGHALPCRCRL